MQIPQNCGMVLFLPYKHYISLKNPTALKKLVEKYFALPLFAFQMLSIWAVYETNFPA